MSRFISRLLILFVFFTHSMMVIDVHIQHAADYKATAYSVAPTSVDIDHGDVCIDGGGHCSHHQAHTTGLFLVYAFMSSHSLSFSFSSLRLSPFLHSQAPLLRPPKLA